MTEGELDAIILGRMAEAVPASDEHLDELAQIIAKSIQGKSNLPGGQDLKMMQAIERCPDVMMATLGDFFSGDGVLVVDKGSLLTMAGSPAQVLRNQFLAYAKTHATLKEEQSAIAYVFNEAASAINRAPAHIPTPPKPVEIVKEVIKEVIVEKIVEKIVEVPAGTPRPNASSPVAQGNSSQPGQANGAAAVTATAPIAVLEAEVAAASTPTSTTAAVEEGEADVDEDEEDDDLDEDDEGDPVEDDDSSDDDEDTANQ